ncbi:HlyD family efflux transporter periplasmic adaptor subunit [Aneurinibacillus sp. Ricciae_BoGa-3]|uniref:HlyD family secretion protein n=1 Tax=Aneurinibacillus sp. Ricciae_BoGa-3 TaxID=3022697 RepID=UPI002341A6E9|nr:HlyD family efflux transporter periplasmic adaptor subunit [Aneurinibacillus sp. Ricciae_BoGa-3]WCK54278.1 HlyD family efflux transporter periplasmic adaptor subunit [Aneurinibacillus sp. Ricciae_BoGa-3]
MKRKPVLYLILAVLIIGAAAIGYYFWYQSTHYVKSDDARITGDQYKVMPQIAGAYTHIFANEGDQVQQNEAIAQQDTSNLDPSMVPKAVVRAPITGTVIKVFNKVNEIGSPGQPVALMMDMNNLYVSANIEETYIGSLQLGQPVDITIDTQNGLTLTGKVRKIGDASNSTFSLVPAVNTSGNFNKVTQRIPIEISLKRPANLKLIPGTNVEIKIHIR